MRALPAGWTAPSNAAVNDIVYAHLPDAEWLPTRYAAVDSFSIKRELVGSFLPGQVRTGSGLSVADGDCSFYWDAPAVAPWRQGIARISPKGSLRLFVSTGDATTGLQIPLGTFDADADAGALSTSNMSVDLIDQRIAQRKVNRFPGYVYPGATGYYFAPTPVDVAWVVDRLAREVGYFSTAPAVPSAVLSAPRQHGNLAEVGLYFDSYFSSDIYGLTVGLSATASTFVTFTEPTSATSRVSFQGSRAITGGEPGFKVLGNVLKVFNDSMSSDVSGSIIRGADPANPFRVEVEFQRLGVPGAWTSARARARSSATAAWSAWVSDATVTSTEDTVSFSHVLVGGLFSNYEALQITPVSDPNVWISPNADIQSLGRIIDVASLPSSQDAWGGIQDVVASCLGGAMVNADGVLIVRDFSWMRGSRPDDATLEVEADLAELQWEEMSADIADRVEVSYKPADITGRLTLEDPTLWVADEAVRVPGNTTVAIRIDVTEASHAPLAWLPEWDVVTDVIGKQSRWNARPFRDGGGTQPANTALTFALTEVNSTRFTLSITNNTPTTLYMVNADGDPALTLRAEFVATQDVEAIVASGLAADDATRPLRVDLGNWCQSDADALAALSLVTSQTRDSKWRINSVAVPFDWRRELGDVYRLTHARIDLNVRVLVVGIDLQGTPGDYRQTLDLVVLDTTIYDFNTARDTANAAATIATFDALWSGKTIADFNLNPLKTA